jgi:hypothetical protein
LITKERIEGVLVGGLTLVSLGACAAVPQQGDIERSVDFRGRLQKLTTDSSIDARASRVTLETEKLTGWSTRSVVITPGIYQSRFGRNVISFGTSGDLLAIDCKWNLETPVWYSNYDPRTQTLRGDKNKLSLEVGSCTQLEQDRIRITVGIYNFPEPLSIQVPAPERHARLDKALEWFAVSSKKQTDHQIWESPNMLVGEAAGYLYHDVPGLIPHSTLFEKKDNNYYRLVLIGERTIVAIDVYGTTSTPVNKLQAAVFPIVQALRFDKPLAGR